MKGVQREAEAVAKRASAERASAGEKGRKREVGRKGRSGWAAKLAKPGRGGGKGPGQFLG